MADDTMTVEQARQRLKAVTLCGTADQVAASEQAIDALIAAVRAEEQETVIAVEGHGTAPDTVVDGYSYSADVVRQKIAAVRAFEREQYGVAELQQAAVRAEREPSAHTKRVMAEVDAAIDEEFR